jgi:DNA repair protein RecO
MKIHQETALLLEVVDLQERDRIVGFLTAEGGRRRGAARGARTKFSRFAGSLQPLAKVELTWVEKEGRELVRIDDAAMVRPAAPLQEELEGILLGAYLAESVTAFTLEGDPAPTVYRLLDSTLEALLAGADRDLCARYFEVWLLRLSGLLPVPRECPLCGRLFEREVVFLEDEAALVCGDCGQGERWLPVGKAELDFLRRSGRENLEKMAAARWPTAALRHLEDLLGRIRRNYLEQELRSYQVMRETLAGLPPEPKAPGAGG